jgi:hypothetical protein
MGLWRKFWPAEGVRFSDALPRGAIAGFCCIPVPCGMSTWAQSASFLCVAENEIYNTFETTYEW